MHCLQTHNPQNAQREPIPPLIEAQQILQKSKARGLSISCCDELLELLNGEKPEEATGEAVLAEGKSSLVDSIIESSSLLLLLALNVKCFKGVDETGNEGVSGRILASKGICELEDKVEELDNCSFKNSFCCCA